MNRLTFHVAVALTLTGCGTFPPNYPAGMPALASAEASLEKCTPIAGRYADAGASIRDDGTRLGAVSLTRVLHPAPPPAGTADAVVIRGPDLDVIEVESFGTGRSLGLLRQPLVKEIHEKYRSQGYACTKGFVPFRIRSDFGALAPAPIAGYFSDELWLRKAADGSLIVLHIGSSGGLVVLVPWGSHAAEWYRFAPLPEERR